MTNSRTALVVTKNDFRSETDGGSKRTAAFVKELESAGFEVDWVAVRPFKASRPTPRSQSPIGLLASFLRVFAALAECRSLSVLKWQSRHAIRHIAALLGNRRYDLLAVEHSQLAPYGAIGRAQLNCINMHNVEAELLSNFSGSSSRRRERIVAAYESRRLHSLELSLPARFDLVSVVSSHDRSFFDQLPSPAQDRVIVAPNGVSSEFFELASTRSNEVVFVAHLGWRPNVDGAEWLVTAVWPLVEAQQPQLSLRLVGRSPSARATSLVRPSVTLHPDVPSVAPYLARASVATAPLLSAGGTRIKILEALASGVPVVATSLGALGLESLASDYFVVADSAEEFADALCRMSRLDIDRQAVRDLVTPFRWSSSLRPLMDAIDTALADRAVAP